MISLSNLGLRRIVFSLVVLAYIGFLTKITVSMFTPGSGIAAMGHFDFIYTGDTHNLIHELVFALMIGTAAVGLLSQLWKPKEHVAGQLVALFAWIAMIVAAALTNNWVPQPLFLIFGGLTLLATILHPAGRGLFNWFSVERIHPILLALVSIAAVPLFVLAFTNIGLQTAGGGGTGFTGFFGHNRPAFHGGDAVIDQELLQDQPSNDLGGMATEDEAVHDEKHVAEGHYRNFAAFSFIVIAAGILASFRPRGWRLSAWVAGGLPILLGLASVALPDAESSLGLFWSLTAVAWGIHFVVMAEFIHRGIRIHPRLAGQPLIHPQA